MKKPLSWYLLKTDRIAAWMLLGSMFAYFISGYGMTKEIINYSLAYNLHVKILPLVILASFALHSSYAISLALKRWKIWNLFTKIFLIVFYVIFLISIFYINGYRPQENRGTTPATNQPNKATVNPPQGTGTKTFTLNELSQFDGKNGRPAYIAVDGIVYNVSGVFVNGSHHGFTAGRDLSAAFHNQHSPGTLASIPIVGKLR